MGASVVAFGLMVQQRVKILKFLMNLSDGPNCVHSESQSVLFQLDLITSAGSILVPQASLLICGWINLCGTQQQFSWGRYPTASSQIKSKQRMQRKERVGVKRNEECEISLLLHSEIAEADRD